MKSIIKGFIVAAAVLSFAVAANAEEATKSSDNISFNYGYNTFSVTDNTTVGSETEFTVMLVKGDYSEASLAGVTAADICYIGQAGGTSYSKLFNNLGVKYTDGKFQPGVYTLVTSGYGMQEATKTKIFLGNAVTATATLSEYMHTNFAGKNVSFGTMSQTLKVYETATPDHYIYVGVGEFDINGAVTTEDLGFVVQKQENGAGLQKGYRSLKDFGITALEKVGSMECVLNIGIQINGLAKTTEVVAIPYVID